MIYPAKIIYDHGFEAGLNILKPVLGEDYKYILNRFKHLHGREDPLYIITLLDRYIYSPHSRREFIESLRNMVNIGELRNIPRILKISNQAFNRIMDNLSMLYRFLERQYYVTINNNTMLSIILGIPPRSRYLTDKVIKRVKWIARQLRNHNNIILLAPDFAGKTTYLYFTGSVFMLKYDLPLTYSLEPTRYNGPLPLLLDNARLDQLAYLRDKWFIASAKEININVLNKLYDNMVIFRYNEIPYDREYRDKTIIISTDKQLYDEGEVKSIAYNMALPEERELLRLHIKYFSKKINIREEYYNLGEFLRRILLKLHLSKYDYDLMALLLSLHYNIVIIPLSVIKILLDLLGVRTGRIRFLEHITRRVIAIPHEQWIKAIGEIIEEDNILSKLYRRYMEAMNKINETRTSIVHEISNEYEAISAGLSFREIIDSLCGKTYRRLLTISPIHYIEETQAPRLQIFTNAILNGRITERNLKELLLEYVRTDHFVNTAELDIDKKIEHVNNIIIKTMDLDEVNNALYKILIGEKEDIIAEYITRKIIRSSSNYKILKEIMKKEKIPEELISLARLKTMDLKTYIEEDYRKNRSSPLLCYLIGDYKCLVKDEEILRKYHLALFLSKMQEYHKLIGVVYKMIIGLEENIRHGSIKLLPVMFNLHSLLYWSYISRGEIGKAKEVVNDIKQTYGKFLDLLDKATYRRLTKKIDIFEKIISGKTTNKTENLEEIFANVLINYLNRNIDGVIRNIDKIPLAEIKEYDPKRVKLVVDSYIIGLKTGYKPNIMNIIKSLSYTNPYLGLQLFRLMNHYLLYIIRNRIDLPRDFDRIIREIDESSKIMYNWNLLYRITLRRRLAIYYLRRDMLDKAEEEINKALDLLDKLQNMPPDLISKIGDQCRLWLGIIKARKKEDLNNVATLFKALMKRFEDKYKHLVKYWYAYTLYKLGLYRSSIDTLYELLLEDRDPVRKLFYLILAHKISLHINPAISSKYLDMLLLAISRIHRIDLRIMNKLYNHVKYLERRNYTKYIETLIKYLIDKFVGDENFRGQIISDHRLLTNFIGLIEYNISKLGRDTALKLYNILKEYSRNSDIIKIALKMLIVNNEFKEAMKYLENNKKSLEDPIYHVFKAIILYRLGEEKKAYKTVVKHRIHVDDQFLNSWLKFLRGKYFSSKKKYAEAQREYIELISLGTGKLVPTLMAEANLDVAEYLAMRGDLGRAVKYYVDALNYYERLVFEYRKLNLLSKMEYIMGKLILVSNMLKTTPLADEIRDTICRRLRRYSRRLHPLLYRRHFSTLSINCQ